jgi:hypothetical protein
MTSRSPNLSLKYFGKNFAIVVGLVLIWRGIWEILDKIDMTFFHGDYLWTAVGGIIVGFLILYLPDNDLKEIQHL